MRIPCGQFRVTPVQAGYERSGICAENTGRSIWRVCLLTALLASASASYAQPISLTEILSNGAFGVQWAGISNTVYRVQSSTNLAQVGAWVTEDLVSGSASGSVRWMVPESLESSKFYRVALPQPEILDVEPAIAVAGSQVNLYIAGQDFGSNDVLKLNSQVLSNITVLSPTLLEVSFVPDVPGQYQFELDSAATGLKSTYSYAWTVVSQPGSSEARLEPPATPLAAPTSLGAIGQMRDYDREAPELCPFSGELQSSAVDLVVPGRGLDFVVARTYRSQTGGTTALGNRWDFSYNLSVQQLSPDILLHSGEGRDDIFFHQSNGTYVANGFFREGTFSNNVFRLTFADSGFWEFNPFDGSGTAGKIARSVDRNGNTIAFAYDFSGRLTTVVDDLGRTNSLAYNPAGLLQSVTDFSGRAVTYTYYGGGGGGGSVGDLKSVTTPAVTNTPNGNDFPAGKTTTFTYTSGFSDERLNHNLASITDAIGQTWFQVFYRTNTNPADFDYDCVDYIQRGSSLVKLRRFPQIPAPTNQYASVLAIINDGVGNVSEAFFDARNRCVRLLQYTGRANPALPTTQTDNRPAGRLRSSDPAFYETDCQWNPDSCCTRLTLPDGIVNEFLYQRAFAQNSYNLNRRHAADLRVIHQYASGPVDLDGDGIPDISLRASYFDYDPRFGSCERIKVKFYWDRHGKNDDAGIALQNWDGATKAKAINTKGTGATLRGAHPLIAQATARAINTKGTGATLRSVHSSWDGTIKGTACEALPDLDAGAHAVDCAARKGWDGTIKGFSEPGIPNMDASAHEVAVRGWDPDSKGAFTASVRKGWDGTIKGLSIAIADLDRDGRMDFAVRSSDFNHNVTTATYDAKGNPVVINHQGRLLDGSDSPLVNLAYNSFGQVIARTNAPDANGARRVDLLQYYSAGPQTGFCSSWTIDADGPSPIQTSFQYDSRGNPTRVIDPRGNDSLYTYNALDQCVRCQSPTNVSARSTSELFYDANNNLVQVTVELRDQNDSLYSAKSDFWLYNPLDLCSSHVEQVSAAHFITNSFVYDSNDNLVAIHSPEAVNGHDPANITLLSYDERDLLFQIVHGPNLPNSGTNIYSYDPDGRCAAITVGQCGANPPALHFYSYDGFGRPQSSTDPMGNLTVYAFDPNDNLTYQRHDGETNDLPGSASNLRLAECRYEYDSLDRCIASHGSLFDLHSQLPIVGGLNTTTFSYVPNGQLTLISDQLHNGGRYAFDSIGRLLSFTDAKTNSVTYSYDLSGNTLSATSSDSSDLGGSLQVFVTSYTYDNLNRCVSASDNVGNTNSFAYDSLDRCVRTIDPGGNLCGWTYDDLGRCTLALADLNGDGLLDFTIDAGRAWSYDDNSRCIATTDANTNTTLYSYDSLDRCLAVTNADGTTHLLIWSPRSNLVGEQDPNGSVVSNSFDLLDRCTRRDFTPGSGVSPSTTFEVFAYDGCSRLVLASNNVSTSSFAYDSLGDCIASTQDGLTTSAAYDSVGNRLSLSYSSGRVVTYSYDSLYQVSSLNTAASLGLPPANLAQYLYDGPNRLGRIARANGIGTRLFWDGMVSPPNASGDYGWQQVSNINHQVAGGGPVIDRRAASFDRTQNKTLRAQTVAWTQGGSTVTVVRAYDKLHRLLRVRKSQGAATDETDYLLDAEGNRLAVTNNGAPSFYARDATLPEPGDFQMDQYTITPFASEQYDRNGNLVVRNTSTGARHYHYDCCDRLVQVDAFSAGLLAPLITFTYDALGRRVSQTSYPPSPLGPVTTTFTFDCDDNDPRLLEQRVSGVLSRLYCWGANQAGVADLDQDGILDLIAFDSAGQPEFYHLDELGSALALTDAQGSVLEHYDYDDYGAPSFYTSDGVLMLDTNGLAVTASPHGNPFLFRTMFWDSEIALYAGSMDPATGRLIWRMRKRPELLRQLGGNAFTFAADNPWSSRSKTEGGFNPANGFTADVAFEHGDIHFPSVIHRDLAARNILLSGCQSAAEKFHVRQEFGPVQPSKRSESVEYQGGEGGSMHFRPGRQKPGTIKITRDFSSTKEFYNWRKTLFDTFLAEDPEDALRICPDDSWNFTQGGYHEHQNTRGSGHSGGMSGNHKDVME